MSKSGWLFIGVCMQVGCGVAVGMAADKFWLGVAAMCALEYLGIQCAILRMRE